MNTSTEKPQRLQSLDALRGFDMFFISGGAALIVSVAALFPDSGFWQGLAEQMEHVSWDGLQHHDTIFPLFLFIAGISFPLSLSKQLEQGKTDAQIYAKIVRRGLMLVFWGLIYNGMLRFEFDTLRWPSVLSRIGMAWMFAALIYTSTGKKLLPKVVIVPVILIGYWLISAFVPAPDMPAGIDPLTREGNIACYIDRLFLSGHTYQPDYDPEGIFSTLPAICTAMLGMLTGRFVQCAPLKPGQKALYIFLAGVAFAVIGWAWGFIYPINKALWSSSFVCAVAGYSLVMFALFYYLIDVLGFRRWSFYFTVIGMNSILVYLAPQFINFSHIAKRCFTGVYGLFPESLEPVMQNVGYLVILWLFLYFMYKKKVFLKV